MIMSQWMEWRVYPQIVRYQNPHVSKMLHRFSPQNLLEALHFKLWDAHQAVLQGAVPPRPSALPIQAISHAPGKSRAGSEVSMEHEETWDFAFATFCINVYHT